MKLLVVVDMQNDFVDGALGTAEAEAIVPKVVDKVARAVEAGDTVIFTQDAHGEKYLNRSEERKPPRPPLSPGHPRLGAHPPAAALCPWPPLPGKAHLWQHRAGPGGRRGGF